MDRRDDIDGIRAAADKEFTAVNLNERELALATEADLLDHCHAVFFAHALEEVDAFFEQTADGRRCWLLRFARTDYLVHLSKIHGECVEFDFGVTRVA